MTETKKLVESIKRGIEEKKGEEVTVMDLTKTEGAICQYFVICQGNSPTQVSAIADSVEEFARKELDEHPVRVQGRNNAQWVAMDYSDVMVHVFLPDVRQFYDLENLW
jgi:ribosome-associated protein